jgi:hypothetical protein
MVFMFMVCTRKKPLREVRKQEIFFACEASSTARRVFGVSEGTGMRGVPGVPGRDLRREEPPARLGPRVIDISL